MNPGKLFAASCVALVTTSMVFSIRGDIADALRAKVWPVLGQGRAGPVIHASFPLAQAPAAHALMESSAHIGKILLEVAP